MKIGDKIQFECYNHDTEKDMFGRGWIKEIDEENDQIIIQTTRGIIWVQTAGVSTLKLTTKGAEK